MAKIKVRYRAAEIDPVINYRKKKAWNQSVRAEKPAVTRYDNRSHEDIINYYLNLQICPRQKA